MLFFSIVSAAFLAAITSLCAEVLPPPPLLKNTFFGDGAGTNNSLGNYNCAFGWDALHNNANGSYNNAIGANAVADSTGDGSNIGVGFDALFSDTGGDHNVAIGIYSMAYNTTGNNNTAIGALSLHNNQTGSNNIGLGYRAGINVVGGSNNIHIGNDGADESGTIRIGTQGTQTATYIAGIDGVTIGTGVRVHVDGLGKLGVRSSSERFKEDIRPIESASEAIFSLQPVRFRYKKEFDPNRLRQFGLLAEDVAKINSDLVIPDERGKPYSVRYDAINTMLLNEIIKEHGEIERESCQNQAQRSAMLELHSALVEQKKEIEVLSSGLAKMGNEFGLVKPAIQPVAYEGFDYLNTYYGVGAGTKGGLNAAFGWYALNSNEDGKYNVAFGAEALRHNVTARNTAIGYQSLVVNDDGTYNTSAGAGSLVKNEGGSYNAAVGSYVLPFNQTGSYNIALGMEAGSGLQSGSNNIYIGAPLAGSAGEANTIRIGSPYQSATYIAGIWNVSVVGAGVTINGGRLGVAVSSARFKEEIDPMDKASESILSLRPVTYRYKHEFDPSGTAQFGLVAEEVAKVDPNLVVFDTDGQPYAVRYEAVDAMLLNEFLRAHRKLEQAKATDETQEIALAELRSILARQGKEIDTLRTDTQKIGRQLALARPAPRLITYDTFKGTGAGGSFGSYNSGFGISALNINEGDFNSAVGYHSLYNNQSGDFNTAVGYLALSTNDSSSYNTAVGNRSLYSNAGGESNTAVGTQSLFNNINGSSNVAVGYQAGYDLTTTNNNIAIGNAGAADDSYVTRFGTPGVHSKTFIAGIAGTPIAGVPVFADSDGRLGTLTSSIRFKEAIKPMGKTSESLLSLKPVSFHYKKDIDPDGILQFGLVAEDVAKVNSDLVVRDDKGRPYTVRYEAVNAMLLNEFLNQNCRIEEIRRDNESQEHMLSELRSVLATQERDIAALRSGLQSIHLKLELQKPTAQVVAEN